MRQDCQVSTEIQARRLVGAKFKYDAAGLWAIREAYLRRGNAKVRDVARDFEISAPTLYAAIERLGQIEENLKDAYLSGGYQAASEIADTLDVNAETLRKIIDRLRKNNQLGESSAA